MEITTVWERVMSAHLYNGSDGVLHFTGRAIFIGIMVAVLTTMLSSVTTAIISNNLRDYRIGRMEETIIDLRGVQAMQEVRVNTVEKTQISIITNIEYIKKGIDDLRNNI